MMENFKRFAVSKPFLFGISLIFIYALLGTVTFPLHYLFPDNQVGQVYGDALSKLVIFLVFLFIIWRFGWLKASGITYIGHWKFWLIIIGLLAYKVTIELYAFTGSISFEFPVAQRTLSVTLLSLSTGLVEETIYRALLLVAMILAWGQTKKGIVKSVLLSASFFGMMHLFNLFIRPPGVVLFQALAVTLPGIFYAPIVLKTRSLWPAIVIHSVTNVAVNLKIAGMENYQETFSMWLWFGLLLIPVSAVSAYILWRMPGTYRYDSLEETSIQGLND